MGKIVKCGFCGYEWESGSEMIFVSCPSCLKKIRVGDQVRKITPKNDLKGNTEEITEEIHNHTKEVKK